MSESRRVLPAAVYDAMEASAAKWFGIGWGSYTERLHDGEPSDRLSFAQWCTAMHVVRGDA